MGPARQEEPEEMERLVSEAREAMGRAIAPFSGLRVGASLLGAGGRSFGGCNIENPSLMHVVCAERVALFKALSEGESSFRAMAIVSSAEGYCFPCGACRQLLWEFAPGLVLFLGAKEGTRRYALRDLLPHPFER